MTLEAARGSRAEPKPGQTANPFPIPDGRQVHAIDPLEATGIGSPTAQD